MQRFVISNGDGGQAGSMIGSEKNRNSRSVLLGVIPARGGSKGLRNKSLRKVLNRPLIAYTVEHALTYREIYKSIVTTDSSRIAKVARQYGAEVPFIRPKELAEDNTPMLDVLKHALIHCEQLYSVRVKGIVLFDPTSPVRKKTDIRKMIDVFLDKEPDLVVAAARCKRNPHFHMLKINSSGYAQSASKGNFTCRQDAPVVFDITNTCWIFSRRAVLRCWRMPRRTILYEIDSFYVDIDHEEDLGFFEYFLKSRRKFEK
ncbi:MAG: acylneuraminate cytidylyltransferase family protein [Planctomycetota bacterium]